MEGSARLQRYKGEQKESGVHLSKHEDVITYVYRCERMGAFGYANINSNI